MRYRSFSDTGWNVSEIGLGCWGIGGNFADVTKDTSYKILKKSLDCGINFFDTADVYGHGKSEKILGDFFKNSKVEKYIATKAGNLIRPNIPESYQYNIFEKFIDSSLKNLGVEIIDLLQLHCPPRQLCGINLLHETMDRFVKKGKIKHYGLSVYNLEEAYSALNFKNVKSIQLVFNLLRQEPKKKFLKNAKSQKVAVIARGPLSSGLLSGTINTKSKFSPSDHRAYNITGKSFSIGETFSGVPMEISLKAIEKFKKILPNNFSLINLAIKWILMNKEITVTIPGATNPIHVELSALSSEKMSIKNLMDDIDGIYNEIISPYIKDKW